MLDVMPPWTFSGRSSLTKSYGHVHRLPSSVRGQWFCLDRPDGRLPWKRWVVRPNAIWEVVSGVIIASETRSDGP
jgi:hypothetical protein